MDYPNYSEFGKLPGPTYVAFYPPDDDDVLASTTDLQSYVDAIKRPYYEFKRANRADGDEQVLFYRRPIEVGGDEYDGWFPWDIGSTIAFFERESRELAFIARIESEYHTGWSPSGYIMVRYET